MRYADGMYRLSARKGMTPLIAADRSARPCPLRADDGATRATPTGSSAASAGSIPRRLAQRCASWDSAMA